MKILLTKLGQRNFSILISRLHPKTNKTDRQTDRDTETDRDRDRQTDRQTDRDTDSQRIVLNSLAGGKVYYTY